jgi:hypothetical protein
MESVNQPTNQPTSQPASQPASQPVSYYQAAVAGIFYELHFMYLILSTFRCSI